MPMSVDFTRSLLAGFGDAYTHLLRVAQRSTGCREAARDLVHDAWLRLAEHEHVATVAEPGAREGDAPRNVTAYLTTLAQHLALDRHRRDGLLSGYLQDAASQQRATPSLAPDVADQVMYRQALAALEAALASLPERVQTAFVAHRVHGEPQAAIAERLGVALNTVERDLMQANACIGDALQRWAGSAPSGKPSPGRRRSLAALLGVAGLGCSSLLGWQHWRASSADAVAWQTALGSGLGQMPRNTLPDGSTIQLDAQSRVAVRFHAHRRLVDLLEGAAFFAVQRDAARPFVVQVGDVRVTVLGTRFGVERLVGSGGGVLVQVESGRVRVDPGDGHPARELTAGEALRVRPGVRPETESMAGAAASWRQGEIVLHDATLGDALARLARYAPQPITASERAAHLRVNGRVRIAGAREWLGALPRALPVRLVRRRDGAVHIDSTG